MPSVALLQSVFTRAPTGGVSEDIALCTHHVRSDAASLDATEAARVEGFMSTFWSSLLPWLPSYVVLDQFRWYQLDTSGHTMGAPARVTDKNLIGSLTAGENVLPPQVSVTVTEVSTARRRWGRFYVPGPLKSDLSGSDGRLKPTYVDALADNAELLYHNVNRSVGSEHFCTKPRLDGSFQLVSDIQVDNILDIQRRRRWERPTLRDKRYVGII